MMLALSDATSARSQAEQAYWMLVDRIIRLELPPGAFLHDRELMAKLGLGRTPVREALQRLSGEGLVVHYPHRGMVVAEIGAVSTRDIYEFRNLIDSEAARLAAARRTEDEAAQLVALARRLVDCAAGDDVDAYVAADREFYSALGTACRNGYIAETIPRIFNLHLRLWFYISKMRGDWHGLAVAHSEMAVALADAVARQDADGAEAAVRNYISQRHQDMRALI